jgi:hypothetical protein
VCHAQPVRGALVDHPALFLRVVGGQPKFQNS